MALTIRISGDEIVNLPECPDFSFTKVSPGGDENATINLPFARGMTLPRADSEVTIEDDGTPVWAGISAPIDAPEMSSCAGPATLGALGYGAAMTKRGEEERVYGPRWVHAVLGDPAYGIEGAVKEAVSQLAPDVLLFDSNVVETGVTLHETENFIGQAAGDILNKLAALTQHLATPALWHVRQRVFHWRAMDLAPRYRVYMANGAKVTPKYDPSRVVNRVIVGWGKSTEQTAMWPSTISYTKRQQIVDLYLNAGAEVRDGGTAEALARGVYARMLLLSPEWSLDISIPTSCQVEELVDAQWITISKVRMDPGYFITIPDIDQGYLGPQLEVPQGGFMTRLNWSNKTSTMNVSVGEPRTSAKLTRLSRRVVAAGVSPLNLWGYLGRDVSAPLRDVAKTPLLGPQLAVNPDPAKPPPVDYRIPAVSTEHNQILAPGLPSMPIKINERVYTEDGSVFAAGLIDTGEHSDEVPPCVITHWELSSRLAGTISIQIHRVQKASGFLVTTGSGSTQQYVPGILVGTVALASAKFAAATVSWRIAEDATLIYTITGTPALLTMFNLRMNGNRIIIGHPPGLDTLPAVGARSL